MPASLNLICVDNGAGLSRDLLFLSREVEACGFIVRHLSPWDSGPFPKARVNLFLEIVNPQMFGLADVNALIPNPEWWAMRMSSFLSRLEVLAKTRDAERIFRSIAQRTVYIGFSGEDRLRPELPRRREFLHLAGRSKTKGTVAVLNAWKKHPEWPTLHLVIRRDIPQNPPKNVQVHSGYLTDEEVVQLQNRCLFHVCPSEYEGFGHHLHEARSVGAVVITMDAPPMNELTPPEAGLLVKPAGFQPRRLAMAAQVSVESLEEKVDQALTASPEKIRFWQSASRYIWLRSDRLFREAFRGWLQGAVA